MTRFEPSPTERHVLAAGQFLRLHVRAGSTLHLRRGGVTLNEAPRWLGETVLRLEAHLSEGQSHACGERGWISLQAGAERSELWVNAPQPALRGRLRAWWLTAVAAVRGSGLRSAGGC